MNKKSQNHDTAGYETTLVNLSEEYGDGYGNNVAHGDISVQRLVENGGREPDGRPLCQVGGGYKGGHDGNEYEQSYDKEMVAGAGMMVQAAKKSGMMDAAGGIGGGGGGGSRKFASGPGGSFEAKDITLSRNEESKRRAMESAKAGGPTAFNQFRR